MPEQRRRRVVDAEPLQPDFELESAIERGRATFHQWIETYFFSQKEFWPVDPATRHLSARSEQIRRRYEDLKPRIFEAFERAQGPIDSSFYCGDVVAAAILTVLPRSEWSGLVTKQQEMRLHIGANVADLPIDDREVQQLVDLLSRCMEIGSKANRLLTRRDRGICLELVFNATSDILAALDAKAAAQKKRRTLRIGGLMGFLREAVENIEDLYRDMARQRARLSYFWGMILSLSGLGIAAGALWPLLRRAGVSTADLAPMAAAFVAGGIGAVVSVMWRMTRGRFTIDFEAGTRYLRRMGAFRPAIGAVFALVSYFGLTTSVLQVDVEAEGALAAFFAFVGFFAGFSERVAQDMLTRGAEALGVAEEPGDVAEEPTGR